MPDTREHTPLEIGQRLELRGQDSSSWIIVLVGDGPSGAKLEHFRDDIASVLQKPTRIFQIETKTFEELREELHNPGSDVAILVADDSLTAELWSSFDLMRGAIERAGPVVLWLSGNSIRHMAENAPNIRSYVGSSFFVIGPDGGFMTVEERAQRLTELTEHYGFGDEELIHRAQLKTLPPDPEIIEWLVLLGRGDLV
jgi:hypothetical protein